MQLSYMLLIAYEAPPKIEAQLVARDQLPSKLTIIVYWLDSQMKRTGTKIIEDMIIILKIQVVNNGC